MRPGHVFLVHGHLQDVTCDAILLPTDTSFSVAPYWVDLIGDQPQRPAGWPRDGRVSPDIFWFVDVTDDNHVALDAALLRARLRERVAQIATALAGRSVVRGRAQHLVTLPLIGAGGGGQPAGTMVAAVLDELAALTEQHPVDFAVVVPERPIFEALQRHRRAGHASSPGDLAARLGRRAREGSLSLMIGAGVSMGAGLPSWDGLLKSVAATLPDHAREAVMKTGESDAEAPQFRDDFSALSPLDQAQLLEALLGTALGRGVAAAVSNATARVAGGRHSGICCSPGSSAGRSRRRTTTTCTRPPFDPSRAATSPNCPTSGPCTRSHGSSRCTETSSMRATSSSLDRPSSPTTVVIVPQAHSSRACS